MMLYDVLLIAQWLFVCRGRDSNDTNKEMIRSTAKGKERERARVTRNVDTVRAMAAAAMEGRRKRRHCRLSSSSEEDKEEVWCKPWWVTLRHL